MLCIKIGNAPSVALEESGEQRYSLEKTSKKRTRWCSFKPLNDDYSMMPPPAGPRLSQLCRYLDINIDEVIAELQGAPSGELSAPCRRSN
jgi:hypothetical protein